MKLLIVLFYPSCFNSVPFSASYLPHHSNLEHPWPVTKFHTSLTTDKIVILYVTFCNWSVRSTAASTWPVCELAVSVCYCKLVCCSMQLQSVIVVLCWLVLQVLKQIEVCGHPLHVKCCEQPDPKMCMSPCNKLLRCGHKCSTLCSAVCTLNCQQLVPCAVRPACGHSVDVPCYMQNQSECYSFTCVFCYMSLSIFRSYLVNSDFLSLFAVHIVIIECCSPWMFLFGI